LLITEIAIRFRDTFNSLEEANEYLQKELVSLNSRALSGQELSPYEQFKIEQKYLIPTMPAYDAARREDLRVDPYSTIVVDENHYSVPDYLTGKLVQVKITPETLSIYYNNHKICTQSRKYGLHLWSFDIHHYVNTLKKKPGAFPNSAAWKQAHKRLHQIYESYYTTKEKDFIALLEYIGENGIEKLNDKVNATPPLAKGCNKFDKLWGCV